jgi:hypothetical protein
MGGIAVQGDSIFQKLLVKAGLSKPPEGEDVEGHHHKHVFPLANFMFAAALDAGRATAFGPEVRRKRSLLDSRMFSRRSLRNVALA